MSQTGKKMTQSPDAPSPFGKRDGEVALDQALPADEHVAFIGTIRSAWTARADCPKNMAAARAAGRPARLEIDPPYRRGLEGLRGTSHVIVLSWLGLAPRDLIVQMPRHATRPKGVFALRSPARPNPIGLHVARLVDLDEAAGLVTLDAIDVLDGTRLIDLKPYFASTDSFADATPVRHGDAP